jgi:hypothetical protein
MLQASGFRLGSCVMATRVLQVMPLIEVPGNPLLKAFVVEGPRLKHASRADYPRNPASLCKHRQAVIVREPDSIIVQDISLP